MQLHHGKIENFEVSSEGGSKVFDEVQHKSLNAELKCLYTAITRAKCNLWIYDSNINARQPMFKYWLKRNAIEVIRAGCTGIQGHKLMFATSSTSAKWKDQGEIYKQKDLWEQAIQCYQNAGAEYSYLVKEAQAYHLIQEARQHKPVLLLEAALRYLECYNLRPSVQFLRKASLCLENSRPPRYTQAAKLLEKIGDTDKAVQLYFKAKDCYNFIRVQESREEYNSVISSLLGKSFMRKLDALAKVHEYKNKGYPIDPKYSMKEMSFSCAKYYSQIKDKENLLKVLSYMIEPEIRVNFMKEAELYEEAYADYVSSQQFSGAYRLALAHGWFNRGIGLAERRSNSTYLAQFVLLEARSHFCKDATDSQEKPVHQILSNLRKLAADKDELVKAEANLLLGMIQGSQGNCMRALQVFKIKDHKAGMLESFEKLKEASDREVINYCHVAKKLAKTLQNGKSMFIDVQQVMKFYGFQLFGNAYLTSRHGHCFVKFATLQKYTCKDSQHDIDRMVRLKPNVRDVFADHYKSFVEAWIVRYNLNSKLYVKCQAFSLHSDLWKKRRLSRQYNLQELSSKGMLNYIQNCLYILELRLLRNESVDNTLAHFEVIFSPDVSICLTCLNNQHIQAIRRSTNSLISFKTKIENVLNSLCEDKSEMSDPEKPGMLLIDSWLNVWRLSSISYPSMKFILAKLEKIEEKVRETQQRDPLGYIFWISERRYLHIFRLWLNSCMEIRDNSKVLWATKLAITHFLGTVVMNKRISISILNIVNILTIHSMALLAMMTHSIALQNLPQQFTIPHIYKHVVDMFNHMNCRKEKNDSSLFSACVKEVSSNYSPQLFSGCQNLLITALNYLVGFHERAPENSVLRLGLHECPMTEQTQQCVILTFTIFGNLSLIQNVRKYEDRILGIFKEFAERNQTLPKYVERVLSVYNVQAQVQNRDGQKADIVLKTDVVFRLVNEFLVLSQKDGTISRITFKKKKDSIGHIEVTPMPTNSRDTKVTNPFPASIQKHSASKNENSKLFVSTNNSKSAPQGPISQEYPTSNHEIMQMSPFDPSILLSDQTQIQTSVSNESSFPTNSLVTHIASENQACSTRISNSYQLSPYAKEFIPSLSIPDTTSQISSSTTKGQPSFHDSSPPVEFNLDISASDHAQVPTDNDPLIEDADDNFGLVLTEPAKLSVQVDPSLVTDEIVDTENCFCNACGDSYIADEQLDINYDQSESGLENYSQHFSGQRHRDAANAFHTYLGIIAAGIGHRNSAEERVKECEATQVNDSDLVRVVYDLKDEINQYDAIVSETEENRSWRNGAKRIEKLIFTLQQVVKQANDLLQKATLAHKREESLQKNQTVFEYDDDIEETDDTYTSEVHSIQ